jgi:hypothetical protein
MGVKLKEIILVLALAVMPFVAASPVLASFRFTSMSDAHVETSNFTKTINQIKTLNPGILLFNGDVENDGVVSTEMDPIINVLKNAGLYNKTFIVRGNHDDHLSGSATAWQSYFTAAARQLPTGVTNYVAMDAATSYLTYSFDYDNARFIGLDSNGNGDLTNATNEYQFLDQRLTDAERLGLTHAFIFWHEPEYCVESTHCGCQTKTGCGPASAFVTIVNKHPIVSATFHGHEHVLGWVHMDNTRVPTLTHPYEEFITSPAGLPYGLTIYPARFDYYNSSTSSLSFGAIDVNGSSFTVSLYHVGTTTPVWSQTFTKGVTGPTPTLVPTATPRPTTIPTPTVAAKPGDANGDKVVDGLDYVIWLNNYGGTNVNGAGQGDFNGDHKTDGLDYVIWLNNYGY